jgi:cell division protein FtsI/penicillin-binding protein 2
VTPERLRLRALFAFGLVLAAFALLLVRLAVIQLGQEAKWDRSARRQHYTRVETVVADRGRILDREGRVLARTESFPSVAVDPGLVREDQRARLAWLAERHLGVPRADAAKALSKPARFAWLRRQVPDRAAVERLRREARAAGIEGLVVSEEPRRVYPQGTLAAHVLGFTDRDGLGLEGVESIRQEDLAGKDGRRVTLRDATGARIVTASQPFLPPVPGEDVRLTIDLAVQSFAEKAVEDLYAKHAPAGATVAAVDVTTGDLLAVACRPVYDPNDPSRSTPAQRRNRFFTDAYEPGSVFKPVVLAGAMDRGLVRADERIDCSGGRFRLGGRVVHEDKGKDLGVLTPSDVMALSSNVGMAQIGVRLKQQGMKEVLALFGFGTRTAVRWPGEQAGDVQRERRWRDSDQLVSVSFGHALTATPAQLLAAYAALADGGRRRELRIFDEVRDAPAAGDAPPSSTPVRIVSPATAAALAPMLEEVVLRGTAKGRGRDDYRIAGKTGTAQKLSTGGHVSSFACFGPVEAPRIAVLAIVDEPTKGGSYGSTVAAPYAIEVLRGALRVLEVDPGRGALAVAPGAAAAAAPAPRPVLRAMEVAPR